MDFSHLNVWAILVATVSAFAVGGLWYSPALLGAVWKKASGVDDSSSSGQGRIFGIAFVFTLLMAVNLAMFLNDPKTTLAWGATAGFLAGFGWIAMGIGVVSLFERRPWSYLLINGGYMTVALVLMGAIIGGWRR
jgi:hypothetical protein